METDRGAVLTVRAAARGVIDFSAARIEDLGWWRRTNALITAMARLDEIDGLKAAYAYQLALVGNPGLTEESFKAAQKTGREVFSEIIDALSPWSAKTALGRKESEIGSMIEAYKRLIGDPDDPEFQKKLRHDLEMQERANPIVEEESEEARIERLIQERDAFYQRKGMRP